MMRRIAEWIVEQYERYWWLICVLAVLAVAVNQAQAAQIDYYVDTGSGGGDGTTPGTGVGGTNAYSSLSACLVARAQDLTDAGGDTCTIHCNRTNGGGMDTTPIDVTGWTTSASYYLTINADDFPATGIYDNTKYVLQNNDSATPTVYLRCLYSKFYHLQILTTTSGVNTRDGFEPSIASAGTCWIDACIIKGSHSGTGVARGIRGSDADMTFYVTDTILDGWVSGGDTSFIAVSVSASTVNVLNCIVTGSYYGVAQTGGTATVTNSVVFNNSAGNDWNGTVTATYCASDETIAGTGNIDWNNGATDWAAAMPNYATGNFALGAKSVLIGAGTDDPGGANQPDVDIINVARSTTWDIGAFEFTGASGPTNTQRWWGRRRQ